MCSGNPTTSMPEWDRPFPYKLCSLTVFTLASGWSLEQRQLWFTLVDDHHQKLNIGSISLLGLLGCAAVFNTIGQSLPNPGQRARYGICSHPSHEQWILFYCSVANLGIGMIWALTSVMTSCCKSCWDVMPSTWLPRVSYAQIGHRQQPQSSRTVSTLSMGWEGFFLHSSL